MNTIQTEQYLKRNVYEHNSAPLNDFTVEQKNEHVERALWELGLEPCDISHSWSNSTGLQVSNEVQPELHVQVGEKTTLVSLTYRIYQDGKLIRMLMCRDSIRRLVQTYQQILGGNHVENS